MIPTPISNEVQFRYQFIPPIPPLNNLQVVPGILSQIWQVLVRAFLFAMVLYIFVRFS